MEDILIFFTGADRPSTLGFEQQPTLHFCNSNVLATAGTCDMGLYLPMKHTKISRREWYYHFWDMMDLAIDKLLVQPITYYLIIIIIYHLLVQPSLII